VAVKRFADIGRGAAASQTPAPTFEAFLDQHPLYSTAFNQLQEDSRLLAMSAQLVYELHGAELGSVADEILAFIHHAFPADYVHKYIARVNTLAQLQTQFEAHPCVETLGSSNTVEADEYGLALLLSIVFTNHRFEIMAALDSFLMSLAAISPSGRIASIGAGTGYELKRAVQILPAWTVEAYDLDPKMLDLARRLLHFFGLSQCVHFATEFPLRESTPTTHEQYHAIILCEVLEHLPDPSGALQTLRECLKRDGRMFVTMAINIAQEDHVFWYPDVDTCRRQIYENGFRTTQEWISPQTIMPPPSNRELGFRKGNYIAVLERRF